MARLVDGVLSELLRRQVDGHCPGGRAVVDNVERFAPTGVARPGVA